MVHGHHAVFGGLVVNRLLISLLSISVAASPVFGQNNTPGLTKATPLSVSPHNGLSSTPDAIPVGFQGSITYAGNYKGKASPLLGFPSVPGAGTYRIHIEFRGGQISGRVNGSSSIKGDQFSVEDDTFVGARQGDQCTLEFSDGSRTVAFCNKKALSFSMTEKPSAGWKAVYTVNTVANDYVDYDERDRQIASKKAKTAASSASATADAQRAAATIKGGKADLRYLDYLCNDGSHGTCYALGESYKTGSGVPKNETKSKEYHILGCNIGNSSSCVKLAQLSSQGDEDIPYWRRACKLGSAFACGTGARLLELRASFLHTDLITAKLSGLDEIKTVSQFNYYKSKAIDYLNFAKELAPLRAPEFNEKIRKISAEYANN